MQSEKTKLQITALEKKLKAGEFKNKHALIGKIHSLKKKFVQETRRENIFNFLAY